MVEVEKNGQVEGLGCCYRLKKRLGMTPSREPRSVLINKEQPVQYPSNLMKNTRYNWFTLIPIGLFNYFTIFFNLYFLGITVTQFIPLFDVGEKVTYIVPLVLCTCFYLAKEAWDDIMRWRGDLECNRKVYKTLADVQVSW